MSNSFYLLLSLNNAKPGAAYIALNDLVGAYSEYPDK
jgi:hypothetical protein